MRVQDPDVRAQRPLCSAGVADPAFERPAGRPERDSFPGVPVQAAVLALGGRGIWLGQGVSLYRVAQSVMTVVAAIWIPPSAMNTSAWMAMARAVVRTDASSHASNASRLMPAEQRALMRWEICGT